MYKHYQLEPIQYFPDFVKHELYELLSIFHYYFVTVLNQTLIQSHIKPRYNTKFNHSNTNQSESYYATVAFIFVSAVFG